VLAGIVLVVVCANLTNLSLALTAQRQRELAVRHALGATRARVTRQILTEHAVMAALGGSLGGLVAYVFQHVIQTFLPAAIDWSVAVFAFVLAIASGVAIGVVPALDASRLAAAPTSGLMHGRSRLAATLLIGQVALSLVLLVGSGLFMRTLANLQRVDVGFESRNLVTFTLDPSINQYDQPRAAALFDAIATRLGAVPGVSAVTFSSQPLLRGSWSTKDLFAQNATTDKPMASPYSIVVRDNFFETIGIRVTKGRSFTPHDTASAPPVAILSERLARRLFGAADPIGRRFGVDSSAAAKYEVVGVAADARPVDLRREEPMTVYWPHLQSPEGARTFELRTTLPPESVMPAIRTAMDDIDSALPLVGLSTQASAFNDQWARERTHRPGVGHVGFACAGRIDDRALRPRVVSGSPPKQGDCHPHGRSAPKARTVLRAALRESLVLVGVGVAIGLVISTSTTGFLQVLLFGPGAERSTRSCRAVLTLFAVATRRRLSARAPRRQDRSDGRAAGGVINAPMPNAQCSKPKAQSRPQGPTVTAHGPRRSSSLEHWALSIGHWINVGSHEALCASVALCGCAVSSAVAGTRKTSPRSSTPTWRSMSTTACAPA
jgi:hypothetical protein